MKNFLIQNFCLRKTYCLRVQCVHLHSTAKTAPVKCKVCKLSWIVKYLRFLRSIWHPLSWGVSKFKSHKFQDIYRKLKSQGKYCIQDLNSRYVNICVNIIIDKIDSFFSFNSYKDSIQNIVISNLMLSRFYAHF